MAKNVHVTHRANDAWAVISEGSKRASSLHQTQLEAILAAKPIAVHYHGEIVIHGVDNKIRDKDSYGNDPRSIRDTKF
jgi:uncharacterized protein YdaT